MFSGIGGFEAGIGDHGDCVGYSEINKYAEAIYQYHYPEHKGFGDGTRIVSSTLPDFDILVGGFPCQSFSIAGKGAGFQDHRGNLFFEIVRILSDKRPRYFILENVKGLLSNEHGETFIAILKALTNIGYILQWEVCNSRNFGVPQSRERVYFVGHLTGERRPEVFPIGRSNSEDNDRQRLMQLNEGASQGQRVYDPQGLATTISTDTGGQGSSTGLYLVAEGKKHKRKPKDGKIQGGDGSSIGERVYDPSGNVPSLMTQERTIPKVMATQLLNLNMNGRRQKDNDEPMFTLDSSGTQGVTVDNQIRRLTPIECERLQGFSEDYTKYGLFEDGIKELSDRQRYNCLGNAVTTTVVRYIIERMFKE